MEGLEKRRKFLKGSAMCRLENIHESITIAVELALRFC